jgi:alanyl-tRNA synthetase
MKTSDVRSSFLKFFGSHDHTVVRSDSLIPSTDPTLLFTSAGMVQFKPNFQDPTSSPYKRAASCQKCLRTSDIERVGTTLRHLTFFEMLGNFSFGDYFKKESVGWGWEFITKTLGLPGDRFVVSVHKGDDEAFGIWEKLVKKDRIYRLDDDTNFWTMGPTGPCGPCSEILWDRGPEWSCGKPTCSPACDCDRYLEIWNHVFTQFDRQADGKLVPLPQKNIDTGMGLERLTLLMQGATSPFGTDGFVRVMEALGKLSGRDIPKEKNVPSTVTPEQAAFRRIADHTRAVTFMIADGIQPSNEGRGYVLRRLIRQAVRAGNKLGIKEPFLHKLTGTVVSLVEDAYPEVKTAQEAVGSFIKLEEEKFLETLETGTSRFDALVQTAKTQKVSTLAGKDVFQLYDTYGFPIELTLEMAKDAGLSVDVKGFDDAKRQASDVARQAWKGSGAQDVDHYRQWKTRTGITSVFRGYETLSLEAKLPTPLYRWKEGSFAEVAALNAGEEGEAVLAETPFYPEGGGQVGDVGVFETADGLADVLDTQKPVDGLIVHRLRVKKGKILAGTPVRVTVDQWKREATMRHHTATHLLHKALREVLGSHLTQAGSLVAPDRLRFDFHHHSPLTKEERQRVEDLVNEQILKDVRVKPYEVDIQEARAVGAMALFGEKYGDRVRCLLISDDPWDKAKDAWSLELCGGTHVSATGQIGFVKIVSQSSVSAGVRRIEAVAGMVAVNAFRRVEAQVASIAETLKTSPEDLATRVEKLIQNEKLLQREIQQLKSGSVRQQFDDLVASAQSLGGLKVVTQKIEGSDGKQLREIADRLKDSAGIDVAVLASEAEGRISFVVALKSTAISKQLTAGILAQEFAKMINGSAGGRNDFAQGGGKDAAALPEALKQLQAVITKLRSA